MRQFLLMLIVALTLGGCTMEDDPNPLAGFDPFMGTWTGTMPDGSTTDMMAFNGWRKASSATATPLAMAAMAG